MQTKSHSVSLVTAVTLMLAALAGAAAAQMPALPLLQNAFMNSGFTAAVDGSSGTGESAYGLAGAWGASRLQLSLGLGMHTGNAVSRFAYGVRAAMPFIGGDRPLGMAAFVGVGGTSGARATDSIGNIQLVPVGVSVAFRSATVMHGLSAYASPIYEHYSGGAVGARGGDLFRTALGVDLGLTDMFGVSLGAELGSSAPSRSGGPRGTLFGFGASYALHRQ